MFDIVLYYKAGTSNTVPDALSRLASDTQPPPLTIGILDDIDDIEPTYLYYVQIIDEFKERIKAAYQAEKIWTKVKEVLESEDDSYGRENDADTRDLPDLRSRKTKLKFILRDGLIYNTESVTDAPRLCILNSLEKEIFQIAYDNLLYGGFNRTYDRIARSVYMRGLSKRLRTYLAYCQVCNLNQTKRYLPYSNLQPIGSPLEIFYTICMDFILALPEFYNCDTLLTITDKFSKRVLLLPGNNTYSTRKWA